MQITLSAKQYL
uniref:Uncharacterized protein n=1 Tax=Arundo donax TaxID=35708 RepID=A0A0A9FJG9_ARUDO